jgi:hypothetical protein
MTTTEQEKQHTYEFGYAGNSYFNGSDGLVTRNDGKTIRIRSDNRCMSVEVKDHSFGIAGTLDDDETKRRLKELVEARGEVHLEWGTGTYEDLLYERIKEQWWHDAEWMVSDDPEAPDWGDDVSSAGRSGGWCVLGGTEFLADNFPSTTPDFMVKEGGGYKQYAIITWNNGKILEEGTRAIEGYDDLDEAEARAEALNAKHDDKGFEVDEDFGTALTMRDEFLVIAFNLVDNIDALKKGYGAEFINDDYAELEDRREQAIIRGDN